MKIHPSYYDEYVDPPRIMGVLDSTVFFWLVVIVTLAMLSWLAWKLWELHSVPKRLSRERGWKQARLVFWLTLLGLVWKPLWVLAVILVATDWDAFADWIRSLRHPPQEAPQAQREKAVTAESSGAPADSVVTVDKESSA